MTGSVGPPLLDVRDLRVAFDTEGGVRNPECADRPCGPLQRMRQRSGVSRDGFEARDEVGALSREKPENLGFERGFAKGHTSEMLDVDGGIFWNERR